MCFRYSCVQFFHIPTSKSGPRFFFLHFNLPKCFSLQRRAIFPHPNFKKWSENGVFCTFSLANVLLATAACNFFAASELPKVVREWCVLHILTCKCASRYSGVQFFHIPTLKSGPNPSVFWHFDLQMCFRYSCVQFFHIPTSKSGPKLVRLVHFELIMCFSLQRRAIFHMSSKQVPPHPPLYRGYFSTQPTHKSLKKHSISRLP